VEDQTRSLSEVAGLMGVSERTVRRWIKAGRLKAYKPGRDYRIPEAGLRTFIEESEISPKAQSSLFTQPPSEEVGGWEGPIPNTLEEALEWVESTTRLQSLPLKEFEALYTDLTREEVIDLNRSLSRERELLKPLFHLCTTMPPSKERTRLFELWRESAMRSLMGAREAERTGDMEAAQELVMEAAQELSTVA
jgi:excisionase family DNA binding protein